MAPGQVVLQTLLHEALDRRDLKDRVMRYLALKSLQVLFMSLAV